MTDLTRLARSVAATGRQIFFETTPLFEDLWTGIPVVTAGLASSLLRALADQTRFFYQDYEVGHAAVAGALADRSGRRLRVAFAEPHARRKLTQAERRSGAAIFPSVKPVRNVFGIECSVFHDLSALLTPQFHQPANIRHHITALLPDRLSNHVTFAISQATADDLAAYFGDDGRTFVVRPGFSWPAECEPPAAGPLAADPGPPYFLVIGTREPRKNLRLVLQAVSRHPDLLEQARIVIAGKSGWDNETDVSTDAIHRAVQKGQIIFTGYLDECAKYRWLCGAVAVIYASRFEGFGLPVLESLSVGTPCIASFSAAIPEAGGAWCRYFDPFSVESLASAMRHALAEAKRTSRPCARAALRQAVAAYSWEAMLAQILEKLLPLMAAKNPGQPA